APLATVTTVAAALRTVPARATPRLAATRPVPVAVPALPGGAQGGLRRLAARPRRGGVATVDPHLHAAPAEGGAGRVEAVVDVGAQRVQRPPALAVELAAGHLSAAQAAGALHPDALGAALERALHGLAHGPPERHPAGQLLGHALRDQLGVHLG